MSYPRIREKGASLVFVSWTYLAVLCAAFTAPCDKTRRLFTEQSGIITDGPSNTNYTQDSHCEWLIKAANKSQFITLSFIRMGTECSYDYVFVYDGDSFDAPLLGSFSGKTEPQNVTASSGYMLILLYSDTNYVLDGFRATYAIHNCPNNCTGQGVCLTNRCFCTGKWGGSDCSVELCPNGCSGNGECPRDKCICKKGFSGESCSLKKNDKEGNSWHWLSRTESGMTKRAAHSAVYVNHTDSLYVFGGYDLNKVLGLLEVYRFSTSQWYDENGRVLRRFPTIEENDETVLSLFNKGNIDGSWQIGNRSSFFNLVLSSFSNNDKTPLPLMYAHSSTPYSESYLHFTEQPELLSGALKSNSTKPEPRYGHSACGFGAGFVLYGGKLSDGTLSSELWLFDAVDNRWTLRAVNSTLIPPGLTRHTLTAVGDELYLFGGSTSDGEFSSRMFKIKPTDPNEESWERVQVRGGKELDVRVVAHTAVYHSYSNSILIYGGIVASVARFSKLSDRMFAFDIEHKLWSEIHYPRSHLRDNYVPRERAFHTATIIGNYIVVFGGYSHRHNREEICYDGQMYMYHLGCHAWLPLDVLGKTRKYYPKKQGVFAHAAALKPPSTLLIAGGYHGNVNGDLLAFVVPSWQAGITKNHPESACPRHQTHMECLADPECGWCSADEICYGRTIGSNCTTNLQSVRCGGICPALGDCHSCLIHGPPLDTINTTRTPLPSVTTKLGLHICNWCVQNARCHHKDDSYGGLCGEDTPSENPGWWGAVGTEVTDPDQCKLLDKRPGLTFLRYQQPADWNHPDGVTVVNATTVDWGTGAGSNHILPGGSEARLRGWLHIPPHWNGSGEALHLCAGYSNVTLALGEGAATNLSAQPAACAPLDWPQLFPARLAVDMLANDSLHAGLYPSHHNAKMELMHNKSQESAKVFTFEFLEPYSDGQCSLYDNCLLCLSDAACGWCEVTARCEARSVDERSVCSAAGTWRYLTLQPHACPNCSNYIGCQRCVAEPHCEWWPDEAKCARRGRVAGAVLAPPDCPAPCAARPDCETCLDERGRCVWCEATRQCFSFSVYTSEYQFGLCREWLDRASAPPPSATALAPADEQRRGSQCKACSRHATCVSCLRSMGCGWCHSYANPIRGACAEGDFSRPRLSCASLLGVTSADAGWAYAQCPDVDECGLGLHECHEHADCTNTHGSYTCRCRQGYVGDGRRTCERTCFNSCVHGYCLGAPQYVCHCDLGWTGADCSINCGCHDHSTCKGGVGRCDECQDWTEGKFCESCKPGSHGNATAGQGCRRCDCNDHGDDTRGICDVATGECICKDNTEGQNCERCKPKFYGDPRHGGRCYYQCEPRGMLAATETEGIGSYKTDPEVKTIGPSKECLWIISAEEIKDAIIQFTINSSTFDVPCDENAVYVYDGLGGVPDLINNQQSQLLGVFCNGASSGVVEARSGNLTVHYKQGQLEQGFEGVYEVLACDGYCSWPRLCNKRHCVCREGYGGPNCDTEICRNNCSKAIEAGVCDNSYGRCLCNDGFGGEDCSVRLDKTQLVFTELFNSEYLSDGLDHLRKTLPRFGHTLVADRRGLWMFGGYSLSHGPLNDIRFFDTKNNTWMQVTVEATPDAKMPEGRYFHAAEMYHSKQNIYIYGGLSLQEKAGHNKTLGDFWQFNLKDQRWGNIKNKEAHPPPLAGHTLTLQKYQDYESLVLIGGFSLEGGFMADTWEFDLDNEKWTKLNCEGAMPAGIIGHSTVYHTPSQSLYVYGGILYSYNGTSLSNKLFAFHYPSKKWSELPTFPNLNHMFENLPQATYLHSAVTTNEYMIVFGGRTDPDHRSDTLIAYVYSCNQWVRLVKGVSIVGHPPPPTIAHAMAIDMENENDGYIYIIGGWTGSAHCQVTRISLPEDLCSLWSSSKMECRSHMGCSFCSTGNYTKCYSVDKPGCEGSDRVSTNAGEACDSELVSRRACENFTTCSSCLAAWPLYPEEKPACRWCESCAAAVGECVPTDESCHSMKCNAGTTYISDVGQCPELRCVASDCEKCVSNQCTWTRQASREGQSTRISEDPLELFNWTCAQIDESGRTSLRPTTKEECPGRCHLYEDCTSCLSSEGAEGGFSECHWATYLGKCISPAYQPVYCAGGVCGLVLTKADKNKCPAPCGTFEQCSECLHHSHCGWCSVEGANGEGVCTEGSIDAPLDYAARTTCAAVYETAHQTNGTNDTFSWHYTRCPPENECENNHHQCKAESEVCRDLPEGYECQCGAGHKRAAGGACAAVCSQGCVRGLCVQPDVCRCEFGYVGANCTIQCQCNGHSNCEGPDKLDKCTECFNNTMGNQCEKCKPNFVGDPRSNVQCVPCSAYCHGHTSICTSEADDAPPDEDYFAGAKARCVRCANYTDGLRCEKCIDGYFRGSDDFRDPCRHKMECRSHMGCSFCSTGNYTKCYSVDKPGCEGSDRVSTNAGEACDSELVSRRACENFTTCSSCLAAWPLYPEEKPACRWCESCAAAVGECVPTDESCHSMKCNAGTTYISDVGQCPELRCVASDCEKCVSNQCTWTRQASREGQSTRISEDPLELFNWTCAQIDESGRTSLRPTTKEECPGRCHLYEDCTSCLSSEGAEGGFSECHWATYLGKCISPAYQPVYCAGGVCGLVLTKADKNKCPAPCGTFEQCSECLHHSHCGWCSVEGANGEGVCTEGSIDAPLDYAARTTCAAVYETAHQTNGTNDTFSWHYTRCPPENECENNHHQCKAESEVCRDLPEGYECQCGAGHKRAAGGACAAVCSQGCVRGLCVQPDVCRCEFGYVGANCTIQCQCNGHSNCEGPDKLDKCTECFNNTMGNQCEKCKPNFVGDPRSNVQCVPCSAYCHGHTSICTSEADDAPPDEDYFAGAKARCVRCANYTDGLRCEKCIDGYFRGSDDFRDPCRQCECHGHGDTCDPVSGEKCNCGNNTESDSSCLTTSSSRNSAQECWRYQCVKCKDLYMGDPRNGHQCYKTINIENKLCFDGRSFDECKLMTRFLMPGETVFVAVNPRYMNVDIRVIVDVTHGAVDLFLSPNDSAFVVSVNASTGAHNVELDPSYYKQSYRKKEEPNFDEQAPEKRRLTLYFDKTEYTFADYIAKDLATYITVDRRNIVLRVRKIKHRLVLTLPQNVHDLTHTKFYIIIRARATADNQPSTGIIFFRQDQLHIDLFVFFSVFFSCFFLFLAACVVAWKAKQAADVRRARRRHVVEMLHMAKRPFAAVTVVVTTGAPPTALVPAALVPPAAVPAGHNRRRRGADLRPVAIEPTADARAAVTTVLVRLPGGYRAPVQLALASSLVLVSRAAPPRARVRRPPPLARLAAHT